MDKNYTINDDLRACGLPDDDEEDLAVGLEGFTVNFRVEQGVLPFTGFGSAGTMKRVCFSCRPGTK
ncbi:zinc finger BED domain-containing protein DAYSLEEPER-like [Panicum miliaceum]|uniref:Zinc finger BED domain-containing protein DAYSLEEPER-like n=1 Tax=Panicum miliaceum TaxID=4540 RepID=A0A3L6RNB0_PANMI|nr:zinc finger BED domain-containing protein DAYSLEEPER-like [Panicum miliaceum]